MELGFMHSDLWTRLDGNDLAKIREQRGRHRTCGCRGFTGRGCMDRREFEGVQVWACESIGLKKPVEWGRTRRGVKGIPSPNITDTPDDRCDEMRGLDTTGGHAKGVANTVP